MILACCIGMMLIFILWCFYCYRICPNSKKLLTSCEIIYPFVYLIYGIVSPIMFVVEKKSLADRYFYISEKTMTKTCILWSGIYILLMGLMFVSNQPVKLRERESDWAAHYPYKDMAYIWDVISVVFCIYNIYCIVKYRSVLFDMDTLERREIIRNGVTHYVNLYMIVYSCKGIIGNNKTLIYKFRLIIIACFWITYILASSRRYFMIFFPAAIMILISKNKVRRVKKKWVLTAVLGAVSLLLYGSVRAHISFKNSNYIYVIHSSFAEFVYTYYTSAYFISNEYTLQYGKTYVWDTITKWIPRAIYTNKPLDLSEIFFNMVHTNVQYAFSMVSEGLYNFGWLAIIVVPVVIWLLMKITNYTLKSSPLVYAIMVAYFIHVMRGGFSNMVWDFVLIALIAMVMNIHKYDNSIKLKIWINVFKNERTKENRTI